jgi:hypothetical protein
MAGGEAPAKSSPPHSSKINSLISSGAVPGMY